MENLLPLLILLACPVGMGLMMLFMAKGSRKSARAEGDERSVDELREEQRRLGVQIGRLENSGERDRTRVGG